MVSLASTHDIETIGSCVGVDVGVGLGEGEGLGVGVGVRVGTGDGVGIGVGVGLGVDIGVGVGLASISNPPEKPIPAIVTTEIRRTTIIVIRMSLMNLPNLAGFADY